MRFKITCEREILPKDCKFRLRKTDGGWEAVAEDKWVVYCHRMEILPDENVYLDDKRIILPISSIIKIEIA